MTKRPKSIADIPATVPLFPLAGAVLLPGLQRPLQIFEPRYVEMIDAVLGSDRLVGLIQPKNEEKEAATPHDTQLQSIGSLGYLAHFEELQDSRYIVGLEGVCRFEIVQEIESSSSYRQADISASNFAEDFMPPQGEANIDRARFIDMMRLYAEFADLDIDWEEIEQTTTVDLVNMCCMLSPYGIAEKQALLIAPSLRDRAETLIALAEMEMAHASSGATLQ